MKADELLTSLAGKLPLLHRLVLRDVSAQEQSVASFVQSTPLLSELQQEPSLGFQYGAKRGVCISAAVKETLQQRCGR